MFLDMSSTLTSGACSENILRCWLRTTLQWSLCGYTTKVRAALMLDEARYVGKSIHSVCCEINRCKCTPDQAREGYYVVLGLAAEYQEDVSRTSTRASNCVVGF